MRRRHLTMLAAPAIAPLLALAGLAAPAAHAATVTKETVKYTAEYTRTGPSGQYGTPGNNTTWNCSGTWKLDTTGNASDAETCNVGGVTEGITPGTYSGDPTGPMPGLAGVTDYAGNLIGTDSFGWYSDYTGVQATSWTITVSAVGKAGAFKFKIAAQYAANPVTYTLTLNALGNTGTVPGSNTACSATCDYTYDAGTQVTLATYDNYYFDSGCTTSVDNEYGCLVDLSGNTTVAEAAPLIATPNNTQATPKMIEGECVGTTEVYQVVGINVGSSNAWYQFSYNCEVGTPTSLTITASGNGDVFDVGYVIDGTFYPDATGQSSYTDPLTYYGEFTYLIDVYEGPGATDGNFLLEMTASS